MYVTELTKAVPCVEIVSSYFGGLSDVCDQTRTVASRDAEMTVLELGYATARTCKYYQYLVLITGSSPPEVDARTSSSCPGMLADSL